MRRWYICLVAMLAFGTAFAGGYRVSLQGVRQASMGGVSSVQTRDASVMFFNPAGLAFMDAKASIAVGGFGVMTGARYQNRQTGETSELESNLGTPIYFAAAYKPNENLAVGVSVTTPYGNTVEWPSDWSGRYIVQEIDLAAFFIQPTIAYKFNDWFSVGGGMIIAQGQVNLQRAAFAVSQDAQLELDETDATGLGFNIGAYFRPSDKVNVSLAYRSRVNMDAVDGDVIWRNVPAPLANNAPFTTDKFNATLPLVSEFTAGISYQATEKLMVAAEVSANGWHEYRSLDIYLTDEDTGNTFLSSSPKNWSDNFVWRVGGEYAINDMFQARLGYYYDHSPSPDNTWSPETPTSNRHSVTAGLGLAFGNFYVDAFGQLLIGEEVNVNNTASNFQGDVETTAGIFGLGLTYNFQ